MTGGTGVNGLINVALKLTTVKMDLLVAKWRAKNKSYVSQKGNHAWKKHSCAELCRIWLKFRTLDRTVFPAKFEVFKLQLWESPRPEKPRKRRIIIDDSGSDALDKRNHYCLLKYSHCSREKILHFKESPNLGVWTLFLCWLKPRLWMVDLNYN